MHHDNFSFSVKQISKIEGHARLDVEVQNRAVTKCWFSINDFKRFYSKAVENKPAVAAPSLLSRICGTCSNSHIMASLKAVEQALGIQITDATKIRRELVNAGLYIRDHALHLIVFTLPDVYNVDSILDFDETDPQQRAMIENLFKLKAAGNRLAIFAGGRAVHAPDMAVGGFNKPVDTTQVEPLIQELTAVRPIAIMLTELYAKVNFSLIRNSRYLSLHSETYFDYLHSRTIEDSDGRVWPDTDYKNHLQHDAAGYSHASRYRFDGQDFLVGALARINLNKEQLHPQTQASLAQVLSLFPSNNVFHNNVAQAIEIVDSIDHAIDLLQNQTFEHAPVVAPTQQSGVGIGIIEAPRGTLYHSATVENGAIKSYEVIVPTGQNQINIENDLRTLIQQKIDLDESQLQFECEKLIRAYDPCMSCASHFLKFKLKKS
jgi:coenzyme F420-reducing hydrogenase alpha subunit